MHEWLRPGKDPVTGDQLTAGERASWAVQHILRRWSWLLATQAITVGCWVWGATHPDVLTWWNLSASDYAVIVESLTAMVLILQQMRDAVIIRRLLQIIERVDENTALTQRTANQLDEHVNSTVRAQAAQLAAATAAIADLRAHLLGDVAEGGSRPARDRASGRYVSVKTLPGVH